MAGRPPPGQERGRGLRIPGPVEPSDRRRYAPQGAGRGPNGLQGARVSPQSGSATGPSVKAGGQVHAEAPPRVAYPLTALGCTLLESIGAAGRWPAEHGDAFAATQGRDGRE